jgi:uncharacterized protein YgbK (DUF1537 family)
MRDVKAMSLSDRNIVIVADDLSGATDCGVAFIGARQNVLVALDEFTLPLNGGVFGIDLDTRRMTAAAAGQCVSSFMSREMPANTLFFKKIDSTLRGHIAVELATMLAAKIGTKRPVCVFAAAYPEMGRTIRDGRCSLHGQALEESEIWRNERMGGSANSVEIFHKAGLRAVVVSLEDVRGGGLAKLFCELGMSHDVIACDAELDSDLDLIASTASEVSDFLGFHTIWVGSGGLAHALGRLLEQGKRSTVTVDAVSRRTGGLLFVVGSLSAVSRQQVDLLIANCPVRCIEVSADQLFGDTSSVASELKRMIEDRQDVAVVIAADADADLRQGSLLSQALARLVAPYGASIGGLVVTGGETARAVLGAFNVKCLRLIKEVEAGVPLAVSHDLQRLPVITKAGAFGTKATFLNCYAALNGVTSQQQQGARI